MVATERNLDYSMNRLLVKNYASVNHRLKSKNISKNRPLCNLEKKMANDIQQMGNVTR